jgi:hypothetical protein
MVDENDNLALYNFKTKSVADKKTPLLEEHGKTYTHVDGSVLKQDNKTFYISYASVKQADELE